MKIETLHQATAIIEEIDATEADIKTLKSSLWEDDFKFPIGKNTCQRLSRGETIRLLKIAINDKENELLILREKFDEL